VLIRAFVFLAATALALSSIACSSLTKPDDILIVAEPAPALKAAAKPTAPSLPAPPSAPMRGPAAGGARAAQPAPAPVPSGCGG
jgi:hypothetical protein